MYDVDGTLVMPFVEGMHSLADKVTITTPYGSEDFAEIKRVTRTLRRQHTQGHYIIVWSAGGEYWASVVIKALNLEPYVDIITTKAKWYFDDQDANEWMRRTIP